VSWVRRRHEKHTMKYIYICNEERQRKIKGAGDKENIRGRKQERETVRKVKREGGVWCCVSVVACNISYVVVVIVES